MTTIPPTADQQHRPLAFVAEDGVRCQVCNDMLYQVGSTWSHTDPGPPNHEAALGLPEGFGIQHASGSCAWCDAMRWRELLASPPRNPAAIWAGSRDDTINRLLRLGA
jgi:hypothetical protein